MAPKLFRVLLQVSDIQRAATFYEQVLGIPGKQVSPGRCYFDCDGTILACFDPGADGDDFEAQPSADYVYIVVDDIDQSYQAAKAAGAIFANGEVHGGPAGEIAERPWGERSFYFADPFGNKLCFVERTTMFTG